MLSTQSNKMLAQVWNTSCYLTYEIRLIILLFCIIARLYSGVYIIQCNANSLAMCLSLTINSFIIILLMWCTLTLTLLLV